MAKLARVLVCHNHYVDAGGESAVFKNLVRGLEQRGHSVTQFVRDSRTIAGESVTTKAALFHRAFSSAVTRHELRRLIAQERPDVAVVQNVFPLLSPSVYTALRDLRIPVIQATYNYRLVSPAAELYSHGSICERSLHGNYAHCVLRRCYRNSRLMSAWYAGVLGWHRWRGTFANAIDVFQVPDNFMAAKLAEGGLPREKMVKNVNPFFVDDYAAAASHDGYVLFAGRLVRQKGAATLVEALKLAPRARAVIVGHGPIELELRAQVFDADIAERVEFAGSKWNEDLQRLIGRAAAVVVPSEWYDNLPLILCQANASGKPVLASRINGIPEYVRPGVNGFLFTPGNAPELARQIEHVLALAADDYAALSTASRRYAEEYLDFKHHYEVLSDIFDRLVNRPH